MEQGYSFKNILQNLSKEQKIGIVFGLVILILAIVLVGMLASSNGDVEDVSQDSGTGSDDTSIETRVDEDGNTITTETIIDDSGNVTVTETKTDAYGNVTTTDPDLITTYFPYQVMREHTNEDLVSVGYDYTLRYSLALDEATKTITATIEYCDIDGDKALVQQYINSIPLDLSAYTINYETFSEDAICVE